MDIEYGAEGMCASNHTTLCVEECHLHAATLLWCGEVSESLGFTIHSRKQHSRTACCECLCGRAVFTVISNSSKLSLHWLFRHVYERVSRGSQCCVVGTYNGGKNQEA